MKLEDVTTVDPLTDFLSGLIMPLRAPGMDQPRAGHQPEAGRKSMG